MQDLDKSKEELATEVAHLRQRIAELEKSGVTLEKEAILDTLVEHVIHQDREMKILWANEAACNSAGFSREELIGHHCYEIWPKRSDPCPDCPVMKAMETGRLQEMEKETSDGRSWFIRGYPLRNKKGNIVGGIEFTLDITERKQAEKALLESEERFRALFEGAPDAIFLADPVSGEILDANPTASHLLLRPHEEIVGLHQSQIHPPHMAKYAREGFGEHLQQISMGKQVRPIESAVMRSDGSEVTVEVLAQIVHTQGKKVIQGTFRDITERKRSEDELRESEERYKFLFENSQTINLLIGTDGKILDVNDSATQSLGYKKKSIIGKEVIEFVIPEQREEVAQHLALELKGEYTPPLEIDIITKRGTRAFFFTKGHATLYEKGELTGMLLSAVDITERKNTENELKIKDNAIASSNNAIAIGEFGGNLTYVNPMFLKMWGYDDVKEVLGKPAVNFWLTKEKAQDIIEALLKGEHVVGELKAKRKDGSLFDVQLSASLVVDDIGKPISMMASFVDITERKQAEEKLRESEERFRTICETAQDFIALKDRDCKFTYVNPAMERVFGIPASKLIGRTSEALFGKKSSAHIIEEDLRVLNGEIINEEHPSPIEGSSTIHHIIKVPIRNSVGEITGLCNIGRDITNRKQMEEALRESEERYRTLVNNIDLGINLIDADHTIIMTNASAGKRFNKPISDLIGKKCFQEFDHRDTVCPHCPGVQTMATGQPAEVEYEEEGDDQRLFYIRLKTFPIFGQNGMVTGFTAIAEDITKRKRIDDELRESEEKYKRLVEGSPDIVWSFSDKQGMIYVSSRVEAILGYSLKKLYKNPWLWNQSIHSEDQDYVAQAITGFAAGKDLNVEYRIKDASGNWRWFNDRSIGKRMEGNELIIEGISTDITVRKQAEEDLQKSEEKYRLLNENIPVAVYSALPDERSTNIFLSGQFLELTGYPMDQFLKDPELWSSIIHSEDRDYVWDKVDEHRRTKNLLELEYRIITKNNTVKWIRDRAKPVLDEHKALVRIDGFMEDITQRKQAENALRESEEKYRSLVESSEDSIYLVDRNCNYIFLNDKHLSRLGMKNNQVVGRAYDEFHAPEESRDFAQRVKRVLKTGTSQTYEYQSQRDNRCFIRTLSPVTSPDGGVIKAITVISKDITERKQAEETLREREAFNYALFQYNPVETIVVDLEGRVTGFNLAKKNSDDRLPTKGDLMYKDYAGKHEIDMRAELMKCISSGRIKEFLERKYDDKYLTITISPFSQGAIIISEDITERKRAEELLQKERDTFYSILERAPYGVMVVDNDGKHSFVNTEFTNITGYTLEDVPTTQDWLHRAYPDQHYRNMVQEMWGNDYTQSKSEETFRKQFGRVFSRALNVVCKDGAAKEIEFRTAVIGDEGNIFMLADITERQRMHALLETAAAEWRTTFDAINDAVCLLDPHGKIIRCNNAMLQVMGKPFSQIINHHCWEVIHGVSEGPHNCPITLVGKTHQRETEVMFKGSRWFNISVDPLLDEDGTIFGSVHIMSDISDRMRIQNELQDSREQLRNLSVYLESVREQERTNIAREIHDELAQSLTALKMDVSWLDHRLPSDAQSLSEKTKSMTKLIDSTIQIVKRISAELRPGVLDDLGLVAAIEWQAEEFQSRTGISCNVKVDPQDLMVDQDRSTAIFRIFQETLTNVARHAHATRVSVVLKERGERLTLRVRDNGTGITEEQIVAPQSFGLIGIRERVHPWGGKVSIKGIPGKGTTVMVNMELAHSNNDIEKSELKGSPS